MTPVAFIDDKPYSINHEETIYSFVTSQLGPNVIPTLCNNPLLKPFGSCRLCVVEVMENDATTHSRIIASCHTPIKPNLRIYPRTARIEKVRKNILQLLLSDYPKDKLHPQEGHNATVFQELIARYQLTESPFPAGTKACETDNSHPYIVFDANECINCYCCIRSCDEIQGQMVLSMYGRGYDSHIIKSALANFKDSECSACGSCVQSCPTGALTDIYKGKTLRADTTVRTVCTYCGVGCNLEVLVKNNEIAAINMPADAAVNSGHSCVKGRYAFSFYNHPDRLRTPLVRVDGKLQPSSWDAALALIVSRISAIKTMHGADAIGGISSARCTNEENYLMQKFIRAVVGCNNIDGCARVCHAPTAFGMQKVLGTGAATNSIDDIKITNCMLVIGSNATASHPVTGAKIKQRAMQGIPLIVIDPRVTELARMATVHLQLRPGSNVAALNLLLRAIIAEHLEDNEFIVKRTTGYADFANQLMELDVNQLEQVCDLDYKDVCKAARLYAGANSAMCFHGLGVTEHYQGSKTVMLITFLAMISGNLGKQGCGVNPLRGQNNVQGAADMGVQPHLGAGYLDITDLKVQNHYAAHYGRAIPADPGLTIPDMFAAAMQGTLKALWVIGEDLLQTDPNSCAVNRALSNLEFLVVQELFLTDTAQMADVVLPAVSFFEKSGTFTNGERRVQRVNQVIPPLVGARSDGQIIVDVMNLMGYPQSGYDAKIHLQEIAKVVPFFSGIDWEKLGKDGLQWPVDKTGKETLVLHENEFKLGKAAFCYIPYEASPVLLDYGVKYPFILTTGRILEHYNCGSMTRRTPNLQLVDRDYLLVHPDDAAQLQITDNCLVDITSPTGTTKIRVRISTQVKPGIVYTSFHFPEVAINNITSDVLDLDSKTPEFKVVPVNISVCAEN